MLVKAYTTLRPSPRFDVRERIRPGRTPSGRLSNGQASPGIVTIRPAGSRQQVSVTQSMYAGRYYARYWGGCHGYDRVVPCGGTEICSGHDRWCRNPGLLAEANTLVLAGQSHDDCLRASTASRVRWQQRWLAVAMEWTPPANGGDHRGRRSHSIARRPGVREGTLCQRRDGRSAPQRLRRKRARYRTFTSMRIQGCIQHW